MSDPDRSGEPSTHGSDNLTETVSGRPQMPADFDALGVRASSEVGSVFDAEQLFSEAPLFRGLTHTHLFKSAQCRTDAPRWKVRCPQNPGLRGSVRITRGV